MACLAAKKHVLTNICGGATRGAAITRSLGWWTRETIVEALDELVTTGKIVCYAGYWYHPAKKVSK